MGLFPVPDDGEEEEEEEPLRALEVRALKAPRKSYGAVEGGCGTARGSIGFVKSSSKLKLKNEESGVESCGKNETFVNCVCGGVRRGLKGGGEEREEMICGLVVAVNRSRLRKSLIGSVLNE